MLAKLSNWSRRGELRSRLKRLLLKTPLAISVASADDAWLASAFAMHVSGTVAAIAGPGDEPAEAGLLAQAVLAARLAELLARGLDLSPKVSSILASEAAHVMAEDLPRSSFALLNQVSQQAATCEIEDRVREASAGLLAHLPGTREASAVAWESLAFLYLDLAEIAGRALSGPLTTPTAAPSGARR